METTLPKKSTGNSHLSLLVQQVWQEGYFGQLRAEMIREETAENITKWVDGFIMKTLAFKGIVVWYVSRVTTPAQWPKQGKRLSKITSAKKQNYSTTSKTLAFKYSINNVINNMYM